MARKNIILLTGLLVLVFMAPHLSKAASPWFEWDASSGDVKGYKIYYGTSSGSYTHNKDVGNATEYPLVNLPLTEKTTYYFVVRAYNDNVESDGSIELTYTTPPDSDTTPPLAPKGVIAEVSGANIILKWQANTESDLSGYKTYFGNSSRIYGPPIPAGNVTQYTIENLDAGKTYYLAVTALDSEENESGYSSEVSYSTSAPTDTTAPVVTITSPTSGNIYETNNSSINLSGSASDNVGVSQVGWVNSKGGSGTASGTETWSISDIQLSAGDSVLTMTAKDMSGNQSTDTITVVYTPASGGDCSGGGVNTYFPHIASDSSWETEICIINKGSQSLSGELRAYDNSGLLVDSKCISLSSKARREIIVGNELSNSSNIGYMIFESDSQDLCGYTKFYVNGKYRVAIPAASDINSGDIYISHIVSDSNWTTGISLLNTTSSSKNLNLEFDNGTSKTVTIAANEHKAFTISGLFDGQSQAGIDSAVIKNGSGIVGLEIFSTTESSGLSYLSGILLKDDTTSTIYYPHIASDSTWGTGIVAYNPSSNSCNLTVTPYNEVGTPLSTQTQSLDGKEKYIGSPETLNLPSGTAWLSIEASSPITGFELFSTKDGKQLGGYTGVGISDTDGVFAKIDKDGTGIAFVNIEDFACTVTMTAYDDNGTLIATETVNLSAHEKKVDVPSNLFSQDINSATYIAYSSSGNVVGFQLNVSSDGMMLDALPGM